jgi:hypothetical protein
MYKVIVDHKPSHSDNEVVKVGELKNYWHGHSKLFLRKPLYPSELFRKRTSSADDSGAFN